MQNIRNIILLVFACIAFVGGAKGNNCPPPCFPPKEITGCKAYVEMSGCGRTMK